MAGKEVGDNDTGGRRTSLVRACDDVISLADSDFEHMELRENGNFSRGAGYLFWGS